ncbi:hypothetical protein [Mesorhizobium sp. M1403]|uniref:hypothetical protein n=1 Tax=Mesorhizobium sp. M1403 TaxID=2957097 RepID=UPI00333786A0
MSPHPLGSAPFVAPQQANAIRAMNSTSQTAAGHSVTIYGGEWFDLDSTANLHHFINTRPVH